MDLLLNSDLTTRGLPKPTDPSSGCDLGCKEKLFGNLADRARLRILETLCEGAKTVEQVATATGLTLASVSVELERLVDCGCVRPKRTLHSLFYLLNTPRFLELEAVADEFLAASFKAPEMPRYD